MWFERENVIDCFESGGKECIMGMEEGVIGEMV